MISVDISLSLFSTHLFYFLCVGLPFSLHAILTGLFSPNILLSALKALYSIATFLGILNAYALLV